MEYDKTHKIIYIGDLKEGKRVVIDFSNEYQKVIYKIQEKKNIDGKDRYEDTKVAEENITEDNNNELLQIKDDIISILNTNNLTFQNHYYKEVKYYQV